MTERIKTQRRFHPYKILFLNENFYLVGENVSKECFEFLRISMIEEVVSTKKVFYPHKDMSSFIARIQTPFAAFGKEDIVVRLRVDKRIRRFFLFKKYLPSQEVVRTYDDGDIEVHYTVSNLRELEELIIKWLPDIEILSPRGFNKMIKRVLKKKLGGVV